MRTYRTFTPDPRFPQNKVRYAVPDAPLPTPPTPTYTVTGVVARSGTVMSGAGIEFTALGTVTTDGSGVYSQTVTQGYSGTALPHYAWAGSFTPAQRVYTSVAANASSQDYDFYVSPGSENVLITRPGAFALDFLASSTTGYFAVQDVSGNITIYANSSEAVLDFANMTCHLWPCFSATDAYNTGQLTDLQAAGVEGMAGDLDLTGLSALTQIVCSGNQITSLTLVGCTSLSQISAYNCLMGATEVNAVLMQTDANGVLGGSLSITGNAAPTGGGVTAKSNLQGKGWFVDTD